MKIDLKKWELDLVRPFNLFGASLWREAYDSSEAQEYLGVKTPDAIFIEESKNVFRYYKKIKQLKRLNESSKKIIFDSKKVLKIFREAELLNKQSEKILKDRKNKLNFNELLDFFKVLLIKATILPNRIKHFSQTEINQLDPKILNLALNLRSKSLYPLIFQKKILPAGIKILESEGFTRGTIEILTYQEFISRKFNKTHQRLKDHGKKLFLYSVQNKIETIKLLENPKSYIKGERFIVTDSVVMGKVAFPGKITGKVRIVNNQYIDKVKFDSGNILISISTSPIYLSLMKKAAAIVTDEGGITSHAAILSRELKVPCVIGTKFATKAFKDGDLVEVDANKGIVRKI